MLKDILQEYKLCSGQCLNFEKSTVFFNSNTDEKVSEQIVRRLGMQVSSNSKKYLSLPNIIKRGKKASFQNLKDKVKSKIKGRSVKMLSQEGKVVFIKAILQAILTYTMSCFLLPNSLCKELEQMFARFWWQKDRGRKGIHWCT